jgi:RNA polymerase sigma-54 factor
MLWLQTRGEVTTHIILTTQLLTLTAAQLEEAIAAELAANPALEQTGPRRCPRCGTLVRRPPCPECLARLTGRHPLPDFGPARRANRDGDDEFASLDEYVAQPPSLAEHVLSQIGPFLPPALQAVARDVLDNLDERGYYCDVPEAAARRLHVPVGQIYTALRAVQSADPAGIGARDARECLLLQLRQLCAEAAAAGRPAADAELAERLVGEAWPALTHGDLAGAARRLRSSEAAVHAALRYLRANLSPFPALTHWEPPGRDSAGERYTRPDAAVFLRDDGELEVELFTPGPEWLQISPLFRQAAASDDPAAPRCAELVERAGLYIKCLGQRQNAFARLMRALADEQRDYFLYGDRALRPMTRAAMAGVVGVHESTISRAVAHKVICIPSGRLVPLAHLFDGSAAVKDALAGLVAAESEPLTDDELARRLGDLGFPLARRTVAKYRSAIGILPAHLRQYARPLAGQAVRGALR